MIVPRAKLLWSVALVALPFSVVAAVLPSGFAVGAIFIAGLALVALVDIMRSTGSLSGVSISMPDVVRLTKDRPGEIELRVHNQRQQARTIRVGLPFPREIESPEEDKWVALPGGVEHSRLNWTCTPSKRGNYLFNKCYFEAASPMGFWAVRGDSDVRSEVHVYPNLWTERKTVSALFLNRGLTGIHAQRLVGKGRDFEKLRDYVPGDSYDEIHWKSTAKRGRPVTKIFQIERTQEVYVIVDASRLSARLTEMPQDGAKKIPVAAPVAESPAAVAVAAQILAVNEADKKIEAPLMQTQLERFVTAALVLGLAAEKQGDLFGLVTFSDKVHKFVRAKSGKEHYDACRDALYALQPRAVTPNFEELCAFIRLRLRRRALLVFLTNLDDPLLAESFERSAELIAHQHLVLVNMLKPPAAHPLFSGHVESVDEIHERLSGHVQWHNLAEMGKVLQRRGVSFVQLERETMTAQLVSQYLSVKQRQAL